MLLVGSQSLTSYHQSSLLQVYHFSISGTYLYKIGEFCPDSLKDITCPKPAGEPEGHPDSSPSQSHTPSPLLSPTQSCTPTSTLTEKQPGEQV